MSEKEVQQRTGSLDYIVSLVKAHIPYIYVVTHEESRFLKLLHAYVTLPLQKDLWTWSQHQGLVRYDPKHIVLQASGDMDKTWDPKTALSKINSFERNSKKTGSVWVMKDFHTAMVQPQPRILRDLYRPMIAKQKTLIFLSPVLAHGPQGSKPGLDPTLEKQIVVTEYALPSRKDIEAKIRKSVSTMKALYNNPSQTKLDYTDQEFHTLSMALQGLTELEVESAIATSVSHLNRLDQRWLLNEKKQIIKKSEILEYVDQAPGMSEVGGLDAAKTYFSTYKDQFTPEAKEFGVEPLKGVLLSGVPGTGKSLISKAIANVWNLPLLRLDVGKVMGSLVGSSEERMRQVVAQAESIAPCCLWIDEIEKSLSGTKSSTSSDGGTLARVFGTLLTAMEERLKNVVVIATANDIEALPPELIRRFNEVLFVDLPVPEEREEIFRIHLKKRGRDAKKLKLKMNELIQATNEFTGSEIEKVVTEAIARAFHSKSKEVKQTHLLSAISDTKPIAQVMKEKIDEIRNWARQRARYASSLAEQASAPGAQQVSTSSGKTVDIDSALGDLNEAVLSEKQKNEKAEEENGGEFAQLNNIIKDKARDVN